MPIHCRFAPWLVLLLACGHSEPFESSAPTVGPFGTGTDVQLTFNGEQDYWPAWTQDGAGILYAFVPTGSTAHHRCVGLLPAAGGTNIWELCDNRAVNTDSANAYSAFALANDGRLLYAEVQAPIFSGTVPPRGSLFPSRVTLWLADTSAPFKRTALLKLPGLSGLSELTWTGPNTFLMLQQDLTVFNPIQPPCDFAQDTVWSGAGTVVLGTLTGNQASFQPISGTDGATGYALAENGASIVFIKRGDTRLFRVPAAGGTATTVQTGAASNAVLVGVSCKGSGCLVATSPVIPGCTTTPVGQKELRYVPLVAGTPQAVYTSGANGQLIVTPQISPASNAVVIGLGGNLGHLMTLVRPTNANLRLLSGIIP